MRELSLSELQAAAGGQSFIDDAIDFFTPLEMMVGAGAGVWAGAAVGTVAGPFGAAACAAIGGGIAWVGAKICKLFI